MGTKATTLMKTEKEFKIEKHNIGWISSRFQERVGVTEFKTSANDLNLVTLKKNMTDKEIEREVTKGQMATLGDVLNLLDSDKKAYRDGNWNLFYLPACVVSVGWGGGEWDVHAWDRDGGAWFEGDRVFSPATDSQTLSPSDSLPFELEINGLKYKRV